MSRNRSQIALLLAALAAIASMVPAARADDVSAPVILQFFEGTYSTVENRMADIFAAGYGSMYTPPPGRADSGNQSVGYDQYDRFDLGSAGNPTLYGTETGLRSAINSAHSAGLSYGIDLVWNHSGFSDAGTPGFLASGAYPGFVLQWPNTTDGDYHSAYATGDQNERLAGLVDIDHSQNIQLIRSPVTAGDSRNIPAGTTSLNGRLANVPNANNARFYPDKDLPGKVLYDPKTGQTFTQYQFSNTTPLAGDAAPENATGYLMRNTQWLVQSLGVDMFRLDATKNMPTWVLNYYDEAVYGASNRYNLDGSQKQIYAFGEYYEGNDQNALQSVVRKDITPGSSTVGGNRDTLDFPLFFAMNANLSNNGVSNNWNNLVNASFDLHDDGLNNGSQGVKFVSSADNTGAYLNNVAYAYTLMMPGQAIVYDNAKQFGTGRDFPKDGRGDALGGLYGNAITTLVDLRNRYGRGNYLPRLVEKENFAFEREKSALVLLSNRLDAGYDSRTIQTSFKPGQYLIEQTGNAASATADPTGDIPQLLVVKSDSTVDVRFLRNVAPGTSNQTGQGYLVYGLPTPTGTVSLGGVSSVLNGWNKATTGQTADQIAYSNATQRLADVSVVKGDSMSVTLRTNKAYLLGNTAFYDHDADGDNAVLKLDDGTDLNASGSVDHVTPNSVTYGFEEFTGTHTPGYTSVDNSGTYSQSFSIAGLSEGYHYLTVRAFRHRDDGGPSVFTDWRDTIYVDRLKPVSAVDSFNTQSGNIPQNRTISIKSVDQTANNVHAFLDLPANLTDAQILAMVGNGSQTSQVDRDLFNLNVGSVSTGNHVVTTVTYEITGNYSVQRFAGLGVTSGYGVGLGDLNHNNGYEVGDVYGTTYGFESVLYSQNAKFNPAADITADGKVDDNDLWQLRPTLIANNAPSVVVTEARNAELRRGNVNGDGVTDAKDIDYLASHYGQTSWTLDIAADDGKAGTSDLSAMISHVFNTFTGDVNLDGKVDIVDLGILAAHWQTAGGGWAAGDFNEDGTIDIVDLGTLASHWQFGPTAPSNQSFADALALVRENEQASAPEPNLGVVCLITIQIYLARIRRNSTRK